MKIELTPAEKRVLCYALMGRRDTLRSMLKGGDVSSGYLAGELHKTTKLLNKLRNH